jgi:hypothetical protein
MQMQVTYDACIDTLRLLIDLLTTADIFGGDLPYEEVVTWQRQQEAAAALTA